MICASYTPFNMRKAKELLFVSYIIPFTKKEQEEQELLNCIIFQHAVPAQVGINESD